jgi:NADPH:quinone reductase-like Zn-dependent oxidoreductase
MDDLFELNRAGKVKPEVTATYRLEDFKEVMAMFGERTAKGKMVLKTAAGS